MTSSPSRNYLQIPVLGTGGTISCTHSPEGDLVPTLTCADIVEQARVPKGFQALPHDIMSIDSSSIELPQIDELVAHIARFCPPTPVGIVVLHGTDTMEESALAAACALDLPCPVVFTGAQRPGDDAAPDGPANLSRAFAALASGELSAGVHIVFGDAILPARGAYKAHTTAETAFGNALEDTALEDTGLEDALPEPHNESDETRGAPSPAASTRLLRISNFFVPIVSTYAGDQGQLIRALREQDPQVGSASAASTGCPVDGLVLAAMGSGNIPTAVAEELEAWRAERYTELPVVICSRVPEGGVSFVYGGAGGGAQLARSGFRSGGALRPSQARIELLYELARTRQSPFTF